MAARFWIASYKGEVLPGSPYSDLTKVWDVVLFENLTHAQWERLTWLSVAPHSYVWREMPAENDEQGISLLNRWREKCKQPF